ncbi:MAG: chemotaxis protein CheR [Candidatus Marsarchaeota archaeon]|nr:chemotaxis protein CheR [Candidatus Marsarchaeota archaeon]
MLSRKGRWSGTTSEVSDTLLSQFAEFVDARTGLHFPKESWAELERRTAPAAHELGFKDTESFIQHLLASSSANDFIRTLANHLTIGETYFFRDKKSFEALAEHVVPELVRLRRGKEQRLRIWSAGCSSGEEPYSVAMLLDSHIPDIANWDITILATDINSDFLQKASVGVYTEWSFRVILPTIRAKYFKRIEGGRFEIIDRIKSMVTFSHMNLMDGSHPLSPVNISSVDVICCRNVLMYFTEHGIKKVMQRFHRSLVDGGWLIVGAAEASHIPNPLFAPAGLPDVTFYRKDTRPTDKIRPARALGSISDPQTDADSGQRSDLEICASPQTTTLDNQPVNDAKTGSTESQTQESLRTSFEEASTPCTTGCAQPGIRVTGLLALQQPGVDEQPDENAFALLTRANANQGRLSEALEWCDKSIAAGKLNPASHYLRAMILLEQGMIAEAVTSLKRVLYLDHTFVLAHFALGNLSREQGVIEDARRHFQNALELALAYRQEDLLPESEGMSAGTLVEIIRSTVLQDDFREVRNVSGS